MAEDFKRAMTMDLKLRCSCGAVRGVALNVTPRSGNRVVCCCDDCQAFATQLGRESDVLDQFGGTEIFQTSQSQVKVEAGSEQIRCLRLTRNGLFRWYADCCKTPIGNTMGSGVPFVGVIHSFIDGEVDREDVLGPVRAYVQTKHARGTPTYDNASEKFPIGNSMRLMRKMLVWKVRGMNKPSAFFADSGEPIVDPAIVS